MKPFDKNIILETNHLLIRYLEASDAPAIFENINHDRDVLTYFLDKYYENVEDFKLDNYIEHYHNTEQYFFVIILKETNEVIGEIIQCSKPNRFMNNVEVGFAIGKKYWNKGYTTEALQAIIDFFFDHDVHKVVASHIVENVASGEVMKKCHMIYEGNSKEELYYHDKYWDTCHYYIINPNH